MAKIFDLDFRTGSLSSRIPQKPLVRSEGVILVATLNKLMAGYGLYVRSYNSASSLGFKLSKPLVNSPYMSAIYWLYLNKSSQNMVIAGDGINYPFQIYPNGVCYFVFGATSLFHTVTIPMRKYVQIVLTFNGNTTTTKREMSYVNGIFSTYYTNASYNTVNFGGGIIYGANLPTTQSTLFRIQYFDTVLTQKQINQDYYSFLNSRPEQQDTKF